jgi:hypothetical protein
MRPPDYGGDTMANRGAHLDGEEGELAGVLASMKATFSDRRAGQARAPWDAANLHRTASVLAEEKASLLAWPADSYEVWNLGLAATEEIAATAGYRNPVTPVTPVTICTLSRCSYLIIKEYLKLY